MRFTFTLCSLLFAASSVVGHASARPEPANPGPRVIELETIERPGAMWADEVFIVGDEKVTLVATLGPDEERPALWRAFGPGGEELWRKEHTCPDFRDYAEVKLEGDLALCKRGSELVGLDVGSGAERWRFTDSRRLYMNGIAQGRVAVSVDNEELVVLDAKSGEIALRLDTPQAVFELLAPTPDGPFAVFVQNPPGRVERTVDLDLGEGPQKVVVSGLDRERRLVAVVVGGSAKELQPMKPVWSVPFEGYSFEVLESDGALITEPSEGLRVAWDTQSGAQLWTARVTDGEVAAFGRFGGAVALSSARAWTLDGYESRTGKVKWSQAIVPARLDPQSEVPLSVKLGRTRAALLAERTLHVFALRDGKPLHFIEIPKGYKATSAHLSDTMLAYVTTHEGSRRLHLLPTPLR